MVYLLPFRFRIRFVPFRCAGGVALDTDQHHRVRECSQRMLDLAGQVQVIVRAHRLPAAVGLDFDLTLQAEQGDGAGNGVGWNLLAGGQAQAHHLELGGADDRLRLQGWGLWMGQQADHFTRAGMVQGHGSSPFGAGIRRLDQGKGYVKPAGRAPAGSVAEDSYSGFGVVAVLAGSTG
ncbi:hypothetical protein PSTAB_0847 [Stutzerimonas stutzeri]|uniref:Uncharacterized protein n=1 Tax=Stutzerimonas stutzeri (strain ATCC 17588 / DSM 5190 / CCUG 11256 / JCM 5965 / LMG 11199 / NBRC 14165 / NCIMB 11358 / Stanier 221) TaxID=96563 RepID=F8GZ56_STUS2|nr:hypothetical protein PSTAB_0847 [Stutzerimonas stutzeri]